MSTDIWELDHPDISATCPMAFERRLGNFMTRNPVQLQQNAFCGIPFRAWRWKRGTQMIPGEAKIKTTQWIEIETAEYRRETSLPKVGNH
jgi:hypothetical protein